MLTIYYKKNKERLSKKTRERYRNANMLVSNIEIFLKKKRKKRQYGRERYKNLLEDEKTKVS